MKHTLYTAAAVAASAVFTLDSAAQANVLLEIDVTDPTAVVITSTGAPASTQGSNLPPVLGVSLMDLFSNNTFFNGIYSFGDLAANGTSVPYPYFYSNRFGLSGFDFGLWDDGFLSGIQDFNTTDPAFTGSSVYNLTGATFGAFGTTGDIFEGDGDSLGEVIGSWKIVPAPSTAALLGFAGLAATRRRR